MVGEEGVSPRAFAFKLNLMLGLVLLDCLCNGFADQLWDPDHKRLNVVLCVVPLALHLLQVLLFFMLLWHTFLLRAGLLDALWDEFWGFLLLSFIRFGVLAAARVPRLIAAVGSWQPGRYWDNPFHQVMFFVHNTVSVVYGAWLLRRSYGLARVRYYKPQVFQKYHRPGMLRHLHA